MNTLFIWWYDEKIKIRTYVTDEGNVEFKVETAEIELIDEIRKKLNIFPMKT